jgi:pilus assembly protein Flp/PilA
MKKDTILKLYVRCQIVLRALQDESGQDLVEYALVISVICLGVVSGMNTLASGINTAMTALSTKLNQAVA